MEATMEIEDIFNKIANHMKEGIEFHDQISRSYDFIGIRKYAQEHAKHFMEESENYRSLLHYYSAHYHKLLKILRVELEEIIPTSWYKYDTFAVDTKTKVEWIRESTTRWINWERQTKKLYQEMYCELMNLKEVASAFYIGKLVQDVSKELKKAEQLLIDLESINYDMSAIITGW